MRTQSGVNLPLCLVFLSLALFFSSGAVVPSVSGSDELPAGRIAGASNLWQPGRIAVGSALELYVVDSYKNRVQQFDRSGRYLGTIGLARPSAVAAAPDGTIYIGSHRSYSVSRYKNGKRISALGGGRHEFSSVRDIAVDPVLGDVYVVDTVKNTVKVYYPSGIPKGAFAGLHLPIGVAVTADAVYVLDAPVIAASGGQGAATGSRISVYGKGGNLERSITESGADGGQMLRPVGIAVDRFGNIFVADALRKAVLVYAANGAYVGRVESAADAINAPAALALSPDNRMYVSSSETHSIIEIGLAGTVYATQGRLLDFLSGTGERLAPAALGY